MSTDDKVKTASLVSRVKPHTSGEERERKREEAKEGCSRMSEHVACVMCCGSRKKKKKRSEWPVEREERRVHEKK